MTEETATPLVPKFRIQSLPKGSRLISSLRPGDWVKGPTGILFCVCENARSKQVVHLWSSFDRGFLELPYLHMESMAYAGKGRKRIWLTFLPMLVGKWLGGVIGFFSRP